MQDIRKIASELQPLFKNARIAKEQFRKKWNKIFPVLGQSYKDTELYKKSLHKRVIAEEIINAKIEPILEELKEGKITNLDIALAYISIPDNYFRSGYKKEVILKRLKKIRLTSEYKQILEEIWKEAQIHMGSREKTQFTKLLAKIKD